MKSKAIIPDKPEIGISSQYNFSTETDIEHPYFYGYNIKYKFHLIELILIYYSDVEVD